MGSANRRILLVDDEPAIHSAVANVLRSFELISAYDGPSAVAALGAAVRAGAPFALAFIDIDMPGWDGFETLQQIWRVDPEVQAVFCTGTSLRSEDLRARFPETDAVLVIKKPFSNVEIAQAAQALTRKWSLQHDARQHLEQLESAVVARTLALEASNKKLAEELAWRDRAEAELRLSQRLEAVGQLAAGIAHEINNPIQYMGDNLAFVSEVVEELLGCVHRVRERPEVAETVAGVDLEYIGEELPRSVASIRGGLDRIAAIVKAMKQLSRSGARAPAAADINAALEDALCVSASSYRAVAHVEKRFAQLPPVTCYIAELGQVFLNLIVNAAHAMEGRPGGTLGVATSVDGEDVVIAISDTGCGVPPEIRDRIFDPFFSTKDVGRGTGQGLAIARSIVVERHAGTLQFDSAVGTGTTFTVRVPIAGRAASAAAAA